MRKLANGKYFEAGRPGPEIAGVIRSSGNFVVVSNVEIGEAIDEYDNIISGFQFDCRAATEAEKQNWKKARRARRGNLSVLELLETRDRNYSIIG